MSLFSLLTGLLFRPRASIEYLLHNPKQDLTSRVSFVLLVLIMINTVFYTINTPDVTHLFGEQGRWVFVLLFPPLQYYLQRLFYLLSARLGLAMFASQQMPKDPEERQAKLELVKLSFPYTIFPALALGAIANLFDSVFLINWFFFLGITYLLLLTMHSLRTIYGVSGSVALWGPLLVQFIIGAILFTIGMIIALVFAAMTMPFTTV